MTTPAMVTISMIGLDLHSRSVGHRVVRGLQRALASAHLLGDRVQLAVVLDGEVKEPHSLNRATVVLEQQRHDVVQLRRVQVLKSPAQLSHNLVDRQKLTSSVGDLDYRVCCNAELLSSVSTKNGYNSLADVPDVISSLADSV